MTENGGISVLLGWGKGYQVKETEKEQHKDRRKTRLLWCYRHQEKNNLHRESVMPLYQMLLMGQVIEN